MTAVRVRRAALLQMDKCRVQEQERAVIHSRSLAHWRLGHPVVALQIQVAIASALPSGT